MVKGCEGEDSLTASVRRPRSLRGGRRALLARGGRPVSMKPGSRQSGVHEPRKGTTDVKASSSMRTALKLPCSDLEPPADGCKCPPSRRALDTWFFLAGCLHGQEALIETGRNLKPVMDQERGMILTIGSTRGERLDKTTFTSFERLPNTPSIENCNRRLGWQSPSRSAQRLGESSCVPGIFFSVRTPTLIGYATQNVTSSGGDERVVIDPASPLRRRTARARTLSMG